MSNLSPLIKSIQDIMRQDSGVDGDAQRISQLTWLLFLKVFDALEDELELTRKDYKARCPIICAGARGPPMMKASPASCYWHS
jgi:type I restriction enzyme M protein